MMPNPLRVAIIGSGITGLSCASALRQAGLSPIVFDKGRGIGGRTATRRTDTGFQFDHGAQYITARSKEFQDALAVAQAAGAVSIWDDGHTQERFVGTPGMTGLAKHMARDWGEGLAGGLALFQRTEIQSIARVTEGWRLAFEGRVEEFECVVVTAPAAQSSALVRQDAPGMADQLDQVEFDPCLTVMVALDEAPPAGFENRVDTDAILSWVARDSGKPARPKSGNHPGSACWVAQANPTWSAQNIEHANDDIARMMLPLLLETVGARSSDVVHASAHRWRYARVTRPLGQPFVADPTMTLFAGGDWCLGPRVESAWMSGAAIARAILAEHDCPDV
jgi:renalase